MIESIKDLDLKPEDEIDQINNKIKEKLGLSILELQESLSRYIQNKAEELSLEFVNIAPLGDYSKLIEDNDAMAHFLKTEAHKSEYWQLRSIHENDKSLISFNFLNSAIDDGTTFKGFVFVSKNGKIRHTFAQNDS